MHLEILYFNNGVPYIEIQLSRVLPNDWDWVNWEHRINKVNEYLHDNGYALCVDTAYYDEDSNSQIFQLEEIEE